jgi:C-terminal processing protease CtpA/Prc
MVDTASRPDTSVANAAVRDALAKLGDHHSFLLDSAQVHGLDDPSPDGSTPYQIRIIAAHIGYASIAAYTAQDSATMQRYAIDFQARLRSIGEQASCGWIVDLRGNTGGNMWPMLAGVGPILGDGPAGQFVSRDSAISWGYTNGSAWLGSDTLVQVPKPLVLPFHSLPVAVLTDSMTGSSGEAIAISFRGRPRTRSFGTPTYGLTTGNDGYELPGGSMLFLTTVIEADRSGTLFGGQLMPDSLTSAEDALSAAVTWLQLAGCPGPS